MPSETPVHIDADKPKTLWGAIVSPRAGISILAVGLSLLLAFWPFKFWETADPPRASTLGSRDGLSALVLRSAAMVLGRSRDDRTSDCYENGAAEIPSGSFVEIVGRYARSVDHPLFR